MTFTNDQFRLDGKVAIVTGAGGRGNSIGRAYAMGLAGAGASVVVADLNAEGAAAVAEEIIAAGGKAIGVRVDVADEASTLAMAAAATALAATAAISWVCEIDMGMLRQFNNLSGNSGAWGKKLQLRQIIIIARQISVFIQNRTLASINAGGNCDRINPSSSRSAPVTINRPTATKMPPSRRLPCLPTPSQRALLRAKAAREA